MNIKWFASLALLSLLETSKTESQDVRVKLCGREFIRMVVTSCGSSRLKRNVLDSDLHFANHHSNLQNWLHRDLFAHQKASLTAEDEQFPESVTEHPAPDQHTSPPAEFPGHSTTVQVLSMSSRSRRDVGPAGICCTSGCTMSELIQYC
ncbi:insulin-like 3 (Leydig cell) [Pimephales promelas]|uniref:insulin-like 3 (Leydig cell) n=1 Tax=Pimephales promelas TaxID=90988 RepID=UPI00195584B1|nr:insulin-like 3 (Leydig cell) [Pimephales promelas]KAG1969583.1 insulin-like 3 (Leydig cell) [Pimephales promelas]